ncbi:MAG: PL29 family lyase N-terminal domain-containing protein [Bacteroidales bacterium]|nr:PL29 family lyase N-terminal domain-containing protein [Bacteroidales bacterium]
MNKFTRLVAVALLALPFASCNDGFSELKERVDDLDSRVTNIETSIKALNANIEALSALAGGATINSVTEKDGVYTVVLTNGEKLTINQGSIGVGFAPIMTIDSEGFWMADYQDGKGPVPVLDSKGQKVSAKGDNGQTPRFSVDSEGYWTVSYDGVSYARVLDAAGKPVKALASEDGGTDAYFSNVDVIDDTLILTLRNGDTYSVPVVKDFLISIKDSENIQIFNLGEEKSFIVEMKGVAQSILSAPSGWTASLSETLLTVKAPASLTRSTIADLSTDVSILGISAQGYSAVAKVRVQLDGAISAGTPKASVSATSVSHNSVAFTVATENISSWKYIFAKSGAEAPGAASILTSGTEGSGNSVVISDLDELTSYVIYVLPINGDKLGTVATCTVTTIAAPEVVFEDNYTAYNEGKAIVIAGIKYEKSVWGEPQLLSATSANVDLRAAIHDKTGIFFLEAENGNSFIAPAGSQVQITKDVVVVSRYTSKPVTYKPSTYHQLRKSGSLVMKNVIIDLNSLSTSYMCNFGSPGDGGPFTNLHFDGCSILTGTAKQLMYASSQELVKSIRFYNCYIESTKAGRMDFIGLSNNPYLDNVKEVMFYNNIFYNPNASGALALISSSGAAPKSGNAQQTEFVLKQNTFYGVAGSNVLLVVNGAKSLTVQNNLFYAPAGQSANTFVIKTNAEGVELECQVGDNIAYGTPSFTITHSNSTFKIDDVEENTIPKAASDLMKDATPSAGDFAPTAEYSAYGAKR